MQHLHFFNTVAMFSAPDAPDRIELSTLYADVNPAENLRVSPNMPGQCVHEVSRVDRVVQWLHSLFVELF